MEFLKNSGQRIAYSVEKKTLLRTLLILLVAPFLLANKGCERPITWGDPKSDLVSKWAEDHKEIDPDAKCKDCHDDITSTKVKPKSHTPEWIRVHGDFSQIQYGFRKENVCALCHKESDCATCHQQQPPQSHTMFWKLKGHGIMVSQDRSRCMTCHQQGADFCERCHAQTKPTNHLAGFGSPANLHCQSCHAPIDSAGGQGCAVCHNENPSHDSAPPQPDTALHAGDPDCRTCHTPLRHPDNGESCITCHP